MVNLSLLDQCFTDLISHYSTLRTLFQWNDELNQLQQIQCDISKLDFKLEINIACRNKKELLSEALAIEGSRFNLNRIQKNNTSKKLKPLI